MTWLDVRALRATSGGAGGRTMQTVHRMQSSQAVFIRLKRVWET